MSNNPKFLPGYIGGDYLATEIDDFIAEWHEFKPGVTLRDYLGFSQDEWDLWVMDDSILPQIALARQKGLSIDEHLLSVQDDALAARSDRPLAAQQVFEWLKVRGAA